MESEGQAGAGTGGRKILRAAQREKELGQLGRETGKNSRDSRQTQEGHGRGRAMQEAVSRAWPGTAVSRSRAEAKLSPAPQA